MKAIIMAGGEGRRLRCISGESPKPMTNFLGKPLLAHILSLLRREGFEDICITVRDRKIFRRRKGLRS